MNQIKADAVMLTETRSADQHTAPSDSDPGLEQQMAELGLPRDTCRFLRKFHLAEKMLNEAFDTAHQGGDLEERVSQVYRDMYRSR